MRTASATLPRSRWVKVLGGFAPSISLLETKGLVTSTASSDARWSRAGGGTGR